MGAQRSPDAHRPGQTATWHATDVESVMATLETSAKGLGAAEVARRLSRHGRNELPSAPAQHPLRRLVAQFDNALILFLLAAAGVSALLSHWVDASVILAVVLINTLIGFIQEGRAEQALAALRSMIAPTARVLREGRRQQIAVAEVVPGDIVLLQAGDRVPADIRLVHARGMRADESLLTGESVATNKHEAPVDAEAALGERTSMLHSGTLVAAGQGSGIAVATGADSQIGRISTLMGSVEPLQTPLLRQIDRFARQITGFALALATLIFGFAVLARGYAWIDAFMLVVALAVSIVPEGLPAVITITLAIGVRRMAARHAIIRRLPAVETLGATTVICSDKTGTLTRNEMTAKRMVTAGTAVTIQGVGYAPRGLLDLLQGLEMGDDLRELATIGLLCNDAELRCDQEHWRVDGDPMEGALLTLAAKAGLDSGAVHAALPRLDEIPFDARHRFMATLHRNGDGGAVLMVKGAPDALLPLSRAQLKPDGATSPLDELHWHEAIDAAANDGERILGFARRRFASPPERLTPDLVADLEFVGIVGLIDPLREEAVAAVADCRSAGIAVKMITGDHGATAIAIARQLHLTDDPAVLTGHLLDQINDAELPQAVHATSVFARTSPEHKLRIVRALQARGEVVAMTGDGVNDAPALKQADVGVAMGRKGTEASKEASEMVLTDDNFASIVAAISEGRTVYTNIRKVVAWTLPTNGGEVLGIIGALVLGLTLPMTALQILWINLVTSVTLGVALAFEPAEPRVMQRAPRRPEAGLITPFMLWRIVLVSLLFTAGIFGIFGWAGYRGHDLELARTMVVNTLVVMEIFYLFSVRYMYITSFSLRGALGTPAVLWAVALVTLAQFALTYAPWLQELFQTRAVPVVDGLVIVGIGVALMVILELEKRLLRHLGWFAGGGPGSGPERRDNDAGPRTETRHAAHRPAGDRSQQPL
ncbi:MAG TPA: HAD-IC family P-type ATPase [Lysobacter sp.]|nr:HAD-IC family P-type ATPase [Lysobacter sp.]